MAKYSDAQKEATARYNKKAYDRIDVIVKKRSTADYQGFCHQSGKKSESLHFGCCGSGNEERKNRVIALQQEIAITRFFILY